MSNNYDRPQNKFLEEMYDDFFSLISSEPDAFDIAKEKLRQLRYNHENANKFATIKTREEYLKRAEQRHAGKKRKSTSYFDEDEPSLDYSKIKKDAAQKATAKQSNKKIEPQKTVSSSQKTISVASKKSNVEKVEEPKLSKEEIAAQKAAKLEEFFKRIDDAHLIPESKVVLKKMVDYARKYSDGIVKNYIPFNMRIYADNDETLYDIVNIIIDGFTYFGYMKNDEAVERSFFVVRSLITGG